MSRLLNFFGGKDPMKAQADATAVQKRPKPENILPTMDKNGVTDIVRNLSGPEKRKKPVDEFALRFEGNRESKSRPK